MADVVFGARPTVLTLRDLGAQIAAVCPPPDAFANVSFVKGQSGQDRLISFWFRSSITDCFIGP